MEGRLGLSEVGAVFWSLLSRVWGQSGGAVWALLRCVTRVGAAQYSTVRHAAKMTGRWVGGAREERPGATFVAA